MNVIEHAFGDINAYGGDESPPCIGLTTDALPEVQKPVLAENQQIGVSTKNALLRTITKTPKEVPHWYVLREHTDVKRKHTII